MLRYYDDLEELFESCADLVVYSGPNYFLNLLDEETIDIKDYTTDISIGLFGSEKETNFGKDPYFKVANNKSYRKATKIARISLFRPEYVVHYKENWDLDQDTKDTLIDVLKTKRNGDRTIWDELTFLAGRIASKDSNITDEDIGKINSAEMPDYNKLHRKGDSGKKQPGSKRKIRK